MSGYTSQEVCPWNQRFARDLKEEAFAPREFLAGKNARQLARELLGMTQEDFSRVFSRSPMKRAKLRGLQRNAAALLGNIRHPEDIDVLEAALENPEPLVREHAAWVLDRQPGQE